MVLATGTVHRRRSPSAGSHSAQLASGAASSLAGHVLALQRTVGNRVTARVLSRSSYDEVVFGLTHPGAAAVIFPTDQPVEAAFPSTSTLAVRFSVNLRSDRQTTLSGDGLAENAAHEGSEVNAMRHTMWNALNTQQLGADVAKEAADAHEDDPSAIDGKDPAAMTFETLDDADQAADLANNIIGRDLVGRLPWATAQPKELASEVLRIFISDGLWVAVRQPDGTWNARRRKLAPSSGKAAALKLANLNELGLTPEGDKRWQQARRAEDARPFPPR